MPLTHTIQQGESTISLSERYGLFAETIWNDPGNAGLREKRTDMNVLMVGDVLVIPDKRIKHETKATDQKHRFRRKGIPAKLRLQLFDIEELRANQDFQLSVDGQLIEGVTDDNGVLEVFLPALAREGRLIIGPDRFEIAIAFGHLDPIDELSGVQRRLNNLGFLCGEPDGQLNELTVEALRRFQERFGLQVTGDADDATRSKLTELHDNAGGLPPS